MTKTLTPAPASAAQARELIQALYAAFGSGDLPQFLSMLQPDVKWRFIGAPGLAYTTEVTGHEGMQRWLTSVAELEDIQAFEPRQMFAAPEHVTVLGWERTVAKPTGRAFECEWMHLFELKDGRVARFVGIYDSARVAAAHRRD